MFYYLSKILWFFATPSNFLTTLTLVGLALAMIPRRTWRRVGAGFAGVGVVALLVGGLSPLANWIILPLEERFPPYPGESREPAAGIVVLGGAIMAAETAARGQLTLNDAAERAVALAELARRFPSARVVFSGGAGALFLDEPPESDALRTVGAAALDFSPESLVYEDRSRTTHENAVLTRELVQPRAGERWLLVTSAWHMPRAVGSFRQAGFAVVPYPVDYRTRGPRDRWRGFGSVSEGLRRLDLATKEWAGLVGYHLAGYTDALFPGP